MKAAREEFGHRVLIGIFDSVDDTVLVSKFILKVWFSIIFFLFFVCARTSLKSV